VEPTGQLARDAIFHGEISVAGEVKREILKPGEDQELLEKSDKSNGSDESGEIEVW
jgi:hypothetical protein